MREKKKSTSKADRLKGGVESKVNATFTTKVGDLLQFAGPGVLKEKLHVITLFKRSLTESNKKASAHFSIPQSTRTKDKERQQCQLQGHTPRDSTTQTTPANNIRTPINSSSSSNNNNSTTRIESSSSQLATTMSFVSGTT
jgi:hypothetical protein